MNTGERIKRERKRLGYTQANFAKACGVHRNTQIKYESGERKPDTSYLTAMAQVGIDLGYVLTGKSEYHDRQAIWRVLLLFQENLKLIKYDNELQSICQFALEDVKEFITFDDQHSGNIEKTNSSIFNLLKKSPVVMFDISCILEDVIEKLEFILDATDIKLYPSEKSRIITALLNKSKSDDRRVSLEDVKKQLQLFRNMT